MRERKQKEEMQRQSKRRGGGRDEMKKDAFNVSSINKIEYLLYRERDKYGHVNNYMALEEK